MSAANDVPLDNPVYASLLGAHARFARANGRARRYQADVAPFLGLPSSPQAEDWHDAAGLVEPGTYVGVGFGAIELGSGWRSVDGFELVQMIGERIGGCERAEAIPLGAADVPEMLELVAQTEPGPFMPRTIELGDYLGIRREGSLVAMAGERFRLDGWTEISAVCTRPSDRGQGFATRLVEALVARIELRSERPFLHVLASNTGAIRLYEDLGFSVRQTARISVVTPEQRAA